MTLGANQIAAYAADLLDTEDDINALQGSKRDLYATIREEHGKAEADALKRAVKLSRMDAGKRSAAEAIDTEAERMLAIIERAARAPRATRVENIEEIGNSSMLEQGPDQSTAALKDSAEWGAGTEEGQRSGYQAPHVDTPLSSEAQVREMRSEWTYADKSHPDCLNPTQCGGFSNLGLCQRCKEAAAQGQVA